MDVIFSDYKNDSALYARGAPHFLPHHYLQVVIIVKKKSHSTGDKTMVIMVIKLFRPDPIFYALCTHCLSVQEILMMILVSIHATCTEANERRRRIRRITKIFKGILFKDIILDCCHFYDFFFLK